MSNVKLSLPFYDNAILLKLIKILQDIEDIAVIDLNEFKHENPKTMYKNICEFIFESYDKRVILLGDYGKYELPIPGGYTRANILKNSKQNAKYKKHNYKYSTKKMVFDSITRFLCHPTTDHIFHWINKKDEIFFTGDVYHAWYITNFTKVKEVKLDYVIKSMFNLEDITEFENMVLWVDERKITLKNVKKSREYSRVKTADLNYPIILYKGSKGISMIDGMHRLTNAYINEIKTVNVKYITLKQLSIIEIKNKKIRDKNLGKPCMILNKSDLWKDFGKKPTKKSSKK